LHGCDNVGVQSLVCTANTELGVSQQYNEMHCMAVTMWGSITGSVAAVQRDALHGCDNVGVQSLFCTVNTGLGVLPQYSEIRYMAVAMWEFNHLFVLLMQSWECHSNTTRCIAWL